MTDVSGFPYFEVQFTKDGAVHDAGAGRPRCTTSSCRAGTRPIS